MIVTWSGSITNIPYGWQLCDGSNGTPDLRGRFILGTSPAHPMGQTGGEEQHRLTIAEMPSHSHGYPLGYEIITAGPGEAQMVADFPGYGSPGGMYPTPYTTSEGGNQPHNIMPPYYTLAYIMRL